MSTGGDGANPTGRILVKDGPVRGATDRLGLRIVSSDWRATSCRASPAGELHPGPAMTANRSLGLNTNVHGLQQAANFGAVGVICWLDDFQTGILTGLDAVLPFMFTCGPVQYQEFLC